MHSHFTRVSLVILTAILIQPVHGGNAPGYIINTFAGAPAPPLPGNATSIPMFQPIGVATDAAGNLYITGDGQRTVFRLTPDGILTRVAGDGVAGCPGSNAIALAAPLAYPLAVAADSAGNIYIGDRGCQALYQISAAGVISQVYWAPVEQIQLMSPSGLAVDASGNLYVADDQTSRVVKIQPGISATVIREGLNCETIAVDASGNLYVTDPVASRIFELKPDGSSVIFAGNASFNSPYGVAVDRSGNVYIADTNNFRIRRVTPGGIVTTVAGNGIQGHSGDGGQAVNAAIGVAFSIAVDFAGNLYIPENDFGTVRKVSPNGVITTVAGGNVIGDGGLAALAALNSPQAAAKDAAGNLYIAEWKGNRVRKIAPDGTISTVAGTGVAGYAGDGGPAISAELNNPYRVAIDNAANLYIADLGNGRIRRVTSGGTITTVTDSAGSSMLDGALAIAVDSSGNLYVAVPPAVIKLSPNGAITTVAGNRVKGYSGDGGPATSASLDTPNALAVDSNGNLYIADGSRIRRVNRSGIITTVAGNGVQGYSGDGGPATSAELTAPSALAVDTSGNLFISDYCFVRRVANGSITTVAGQGSCSYAGDGGPATSAGLAAAGLVVDAAGRIYVVDTSSNTIRSLTPAGTDPVLTVRQTYSATDLLTGTFKLTVSNTAGAGPAKGTVTVSVVLSTGVTPGTLSGTGWTCSGVTCTRMDTLTGGSSYAPVAVPVKISATAPSQASSQASVTGGGAAPATSNYLTRIAATPQVTAVVNGASYQPGFATATWISIFGSNLSRTTRGWTIADFPQGVFLPTILDGVSVIIDGQPAYVEHISPGQINALVPDGIHTGTVQVLVLVAGVSGTFSAQAQPVAPGFFTLVDGYAAATHADYTLLGKPGLIPGATTLPAKPGETILLYGAGFGTTVPPVLTDGVVTTSAPLFYPVHIAIGGVQASVNFAGLVESGLYQFNVVVPQLPTGDASVIAEIDGVTSPTGVSITIQE